MRSVPNQGSGAAMLRIEAVRRVFPRCWFNKKTTQAGVEALGYYHERKDEARNIGLGPDVFALAHFSDVIGDILADALDIIQHAANELHDPDRQRISARTAATKIKKRFIAQHRVGTDVTDAALSF
jgi:hypothetical protein